MINLVLRTLVRGFADTIERTVPWALVRTIGSMLP